jgi:photosystem II stability/assembly factor-like uncharacterized protein
MRPGQGAGKGLSRDDNKLLIPPKSNFELERQCSLQRAFKETPLTSLVVRYSMGIASCDADGTAWHVLKSADDLIHLNTQVSILVAATIATRENL